MSAAAIVGAQASLFEPQPAELPGLTQSHIGWARKCLTAASVFDARGMQALARWQREAAAEHERQAEELGMLAEFYTLGGVR